VISNISVLILTLNEAPDIARCLESVDWSDDVHVLDSGSVDGTQEIAAKLGATVHYHKFSGYASQRNVGLRLPFAHEWILILDADEQITQLGAKELQQFADSAKPTFAAARMRRRDFWDSTWLQHAQISPFFIRLVRRGAASYAREVNEVLVVDGAIAELDQPFNHFPFSKGLTHWIAKHNSYSSKEAELLLQQYSAPLEIRKLLAGDFNVRRSAQKALFFRLPFRSIIKFVYMFFFRFAFLDGMPGIRYVILQCFYEYLISLKALELKRYRSLRK
jgi:glycosyltransferase involved in cell wall biosynthesis